MKNLELVELSAQEIQDVNGGGTPFGSIGLTPGGIHNLNHTAIETGKAVLGFLAGIRDGIFDALK